MILEEAGPKSPSWNMSVDAQALENISEASILRFYEWSAPSITYGYFVDPLEFFNPTEIDKHGLELAKRPTGGGIIFHQDDLSFSLIIPASHPFYHLNSLHSYQKINGLVLEAIQQTIPSTIIQSCCFDSAPRGGFCMAKPTKYDILLEGKKVGGAAQRKTKKGLLHQISLCLKVPDPDWLGKILIDGAKVSQAIQFNSIGLGIEHRHSIKRQIIEVLTKTVIFG